MMTLNKARRLALESLARVSPAPLTFRDDLTQCSRAGWRFVGDAATILVGHDGAVHTTASGEAPATQPSPAPATPHR